MCCYTYTQKFIEVLGIKGADDVGCKAQQIPAVG